MVSANLWLLEFLEQSAFLKLDVSALFFCVVKTILQAGFSLIVIYVR